MNVRWTDTGTRECDTKRGTSTPVTPASCLEVGAVIAAGLGVTYLVVRVLVDVLMVVIA